MSEMVTIPRSTWQKVEKFIDSFLEKEEEYLNEEAAAKHLNISKRALQNMVSKGDIIKPYMYRMGVNNKRMYRKSQLLLPDVS